VGIDAESGVTGVLPVTGDTGTGLTPGELFVLYAGMQPVMMRGITTRMASNKTRVLAVNRLNNK